MCVETRATFAWSPGPILGSRIIKAAFRDGWFSLVLKGLKRGAEKRRTLMTRHTPKDLAERNLQAKIQQREFYAQLEDLLKRHQPIDYAPFAAERLRQAFEDLDKDNGLKFCQTPAHRILHSIEANCAFARGQNNDKVDIARLGRIMNVYHEHCDPLQLGILEDCVESHGDPQLVFLIMWREQMELQIRYYRDDLARTWQLFVSDEPLPKTLQWFATHNALTFADWIKVCWAVHAAMHKYRGGCFMREFASKSPLFKGNPEVVDAFFRLSSLTPREVGERFKGEVKSIEPQFHCLIRSVFLEYPLLDFGDGRMLCPHPYLVLRHSAEGLYRLARDAPDFGAEFGRSFQQYVGKVLGCLRSKQHMFGGKILERLSPNKSCDFLVELPDVILLVECKATSMNSKILIEKTLVNDASTAKVARALVQLYTTARDVGSGLFSDLGVDAKKPVFGIVATFGVLPVANSDWYYDRVFMRRAKDALVKPIYPSVNLVHRPVVLSVATLERLVVYLNSSHASFRALYEDKAGKPYSQVGDWDVYLGSRLGELGSSVEQLAFVDEQGQQFLQSMRGG